MDQLEAKVSQLTVRWNNVNGQVAERLRIVEETQKSQMVYRSQYSEEVGRGTMTEIRHYKKQHQASRKFRCLDNDSTQNHRNFFTIFSII